MKKVAISLLVLCGSLGLEGAEGRALSVCSDKTPPPSYDLVKVHPLDTKGGSGKELLLGSSPGSGSSVLGALSAAASYCFSSAPVQETEKEKVAREMRDAVLGRNCSGLKALLEKHGVEPAEAIGPDKYNAFHMACFNQFMDGIEVLASGKIGKKGQRRKVAIDLLNGKGKTSLQVALGEGHVDVATKLVELGSPVEDEEVRIVRDLRRKLGADNAEVKALAELLAGAKHKTILDSIFDTDSEGTDDEDEAGEEIA